MSIPKKVEIKGWIHLTPYDTWTFQMSENMTDYGYAMLMPHVISLDVPRGWDATGQRIAALEKKRDELRRKFQEEVLKVNEEISKLQAIGYSSNGQIIDPDDPF